MKIGQVSHSYPPRIGGIENYVYRLKRSLSEKGNEVNVYTTDFGVAKKSVSELNVNYCKTNFSPLNNPISIELINKLRESDDDIYHLHGYEFFSTLLATKILKNKPKILTQHGTLELKNDLISFLLNNPYHIFLQYILDNMDKIIVLGEKDKKFLLKSFDISPQKITIIPNGIEIGKFVSVNRSNERFIMKYGLKKSSFKILFVGRLVEQKNAYKLLKSVNSYLKNENIEVIVIGDGKAEYIAKLKAIRDSRIHLLGKMNFGEELVAAYNISDLFVLLSQFEGLPTVLLEAMACGLPILTTPVGNIPEIIVSGRNGLFIDASIDEKDLADKLKYFMYSDNSEMRHNNSYLVKKRFNWLDISNKIYKIYENVLGY